LNHENFDYLSSMADKELKQIMKLLEKAG
jgi:hypothetical protein